MITINIFDIVLNENDAVIVVGQTILGVIDGEGALATIDGNVGSLAVTFKSSGVSAVLTGIPKNAMVSLSLLDSFVFSCPDGENKSWLAIPVELSQCS